MGIAIWADARGGRSQIPEHGSPGGVGGAEHTTPPSKGTLSRDVAAHQHVYGREHPVGMPILSCQTTITERVVPGELQCQAAGQRSRSSCWGLPIVAGSSYSAEVTASDPRDYEEVSFGSDAQPRSLSSRRRLLIGVAVVCLVVGFRAAYPDDGELAAEADISASSEEPVDCETQYRDGFLSNSPAVWRDQWRYVVHYNGRPLARDMAVSLAGPIGELAEKDRDCQPLSHFHAHLERVEDLASAGERIPRRYIMRTAVAGDAWLTAVNEQPVFVDGNAGLTRGDRDWPWADR